MTHTALEQQPDQSFTIETSALLADAHGHAELPDDGSVTGEISYRKGG